MDYAPALAQSPAPAARVWRRARPRPASATPDGALLAAQVEWSARVDHLGRRADCTDDLDLDPAGADPGANPRRQGETLRLAVTQLGKLDLGAVVAAAEETEAGAAGDILVGPDRDQHAAPQLVARALPNEGVGREAAEAEPR